MKPKVAIFFSKVALSILSKNTFNTIYFSEKHIFYFMGVPVVFFGNTRIFLTFFGSTLFTM